MSLVSKLELNMKKIKIKYKKEMRVSRRINAMLRQTYVKVKLSVYNWMDVDGMRFVDSRCDPENRDTPHNLH